MSKKHSFEARSRAEHEYRATTHAKCGPLWIKNMLKELKLTHEEPDALCLIIMGK